jgi:hypothetical protein
MKRWMLTLLTVLVLLLGGNLQQWNDASVRAPADSGATDESAFCGSSTPHEMALAKESECRNATPLRIQIVGSELARPRQCRHAGDTAHSATLSWIRAARASLVLSHVRLQV